MLALRRRTIKKRRFATQRSAPPVSTCGHHRVSRLATVTGLRGRTCWSHHGIVSPHARQLCAGRTDDLHHLSNLPQVVRQRLSVVRRRRCMGKPVGPISPKTVDQHFSAERRLSPPPRSPDQPNSPCRSTDAWKHRQRDFHCHGKSVGREPERTATGFVSQLRTVILRCGSQTPATATYPAEIRVGLAAAASRDRIKAQAPCQKCDCCFAAAVTSRLDC